MLAIRLAFFIAVAIMVIFGVTPVAYSTAKIGSSLAKVLDIN